MVPIKYWNNGAYWNDKKAALDVLYTQRQFADNVLENCFMGCIALYAGIYIYIYILVDIMLQNWLIEVLNLETEGERAYINRNRGINPIHEKNKKHLGITKKLIS